MSARDLKRVEGEVLRGLRAASGLSLRSVAKLAYTSATHVSEVERGRHECREYTLIPLLRVYGVDVPEFLRMVADRLDGLDASRIP